MISFSFTIIFEYTSTPAVLYNTTKTLSCGLNASFVILNLSIAGFGKTEISSLAAPSATIPVVLASSMVVVACFEQPLLSVTVIP